MNSPETNDPIEKLLHEQDTYIADDGFTRRVMRKLPGRRMVLPKVVLLVLVGIGSVLAASCLPWRSLPQLDYVQVLTLNPTVLSAWLPVAAVLVALLSALWLALRRD